MSTVLLVSIPKHPNLPWKYRNENLFRSSIKEIYFAIDVLHITIKYIRMNILLPLKRHLKLLLGEVKQEFCTHRISDVQMICNSISHKIYSSSSNEHSHQYGAIRKRIRTLLKSDNCHCSTWNKVTKTYCCIEFVIWLQLKYFTLYKFSTLHTMNNDNLLHRIIKSFNCFVVSSVDLMLLNSFDKMWIKNGRECAMCMWVSVRN